MTFLITASVYVLGTLPVLLLLPLVNNEKSIDVKSKGSIQTKIITHQESRKNLEESDHDQSIQNTFTNNANQSNDPIMDIPIDRE